MTRSRIAVLALFVGGSALASAPPAAAVATPTLEVIVHTGSTSFSVCARGAAAPRLLATSHWEFLIVGARPSASNPTILYSVARDGATFSLPGCVPVPKYGTTYGAFSATLTLVSDGTDLSNAVTGHGYWSPVLGDQASSMTTCGTGCFTTTTTP